MTRLDDTAQVSFAQFLVLVVKFCAFQPTLIQRIQRNHVRGESRLSWGENWQNTKEKNYGIRLLMEPFILCQVFRINRSIICFDCVISIMRNYQYYQNWIFNLNSFCSANICSQDQCPQVKNCIRGAANCANTTFFRLWSLLKYS